MHKSVTFVALLILMFSSVSLADSWVRERIENLEPFIGFYPPNISSKEEFEKLQKEYLDVKTELDELLSNNSTEKEALYLRGWLYTLGHNMNHPVAWQGAKDDFELLIEKDKNNVPARIKLATHLVNSKQELAPQAESLFREAQCLSGSEPIEEIQRGIFFAFYYQGKMQKAYVHANYLNLRWPTNEQYGALKETVLAVLNRTSTEIPNIEELKLVSCIDDE